MKIKSLKGLSNEQEKIYQGLCQIGELIGAFYLDGVMIARKECMLQTKLNLIAHCAREIDGGIRDVFAPEKMKIKKEESMVGNENGHYASILVALGFTNNTITDEWMEVAGQFHKLAHRYGVWLKTKDHTEIWELWKRYEKILYILAGSVYAFRDRIDHLLSIETPTKEILGAMRNLFRDGQNEFQFFNSLNKPAWLRPMFENGFFTILLDKLPSDGQGRRVLQDWLPLRYLVAIAPKTDRHESLLISRKILDPLRERVLSGDLYFDSHSLSNYCLTIAHLQNYVLTGADVELLNYCQNYLQQQYPTHENVLMEDMLNRYISEKQYDGLMLLLGYAFGFSHYEEQIEGFEDLGMISQKRTEPNLQNTLYQYWTDEKIKEIMTITGISLSRRLVEILTALYEYRVDELNLIPSVEPSSQTPMYAYEWVGGIVNFLRRTSETLSWEECEPLVRELITSEREICIRIAIHLIRVNLPTSGAYLSTLMEDFRLYGHFPVHELYLLIHDISPKLKERELAQLFSWLENIEYSHNIYGDNDTTQIRAFQIRRYANAFQLSDPALKAMLVSFRAHFDDINKWELDHAEFDFYSTSTNGFDLPLPISEFETMSVEDQLNYLEKFPPEEDKLDTNARGLGLVLNNTIINDPEKYHAHLSSLFSLDNFYLAEVLGTYAHVARSGNLYYWKELLKLIDADILSSQEAPFPGSRDRDHLLYNVAGLLLVISERPSFIELSQEDVSYLIELNIRLLSTNRTLPTTLMTKWEWESARLNSTAGKGYETVKNLNSLWNTWKENNGLHPLFKEFFEGKLKRTGVQEQEFSLALGHCFPYLLATDPAWCQQEKEKIFSSGDLVHLRLTTASVLWAGEMIYGNVIKFLRVNELNPVFLDLYSNEGAEMDRLCRYALTDLSHFNQDAMEHQDSLIYLLFARASSVQLSGLIRAANQMKFVPKHVLIRVWKKVLEIALEDPATFKKTLSQVAEFALLGLIGNEQLELLELSLEFLESGPLSYRLCEKIAESDADPKHAAQVLLDIWKRTQMQVANSKALTDFVERLYQQQECKELADEIANYVASKGDVGLKAVYDRVQIDRLPKKK